MVGTEVPVAQLYVVVFTPEFVTGYFPLGHDGVKFAVEVNGHGTHAVVSQFPFVTTPATVCPLGHVVVTVRVLLPPLYPAPHACVSVVLPGVQTIGSQMPGFVAVVVGTAVPVAHE